MASPIGHNASCFLSSLLLQNPASRRHGKKSFNHIGEDNVVDSILNKNID